MFFILSFYIALTIFVLGFIFRISTWFGYGISLQAQTIPWSKRFLSFILGSLRIIFSRKILLMLHTFLFEVLFQKRLLQKNKLRWFMHICLFWGFILLLFFHALDNFITSELFPNYYPTKNPYLFLRNFFGFLVIIGILTAFYKRFILKTPRSVNSFQDYYALAIVAIIILSGFLLEGFKITSYSRYQDMVKLYTFTSSDKELSALEAYWVKEYGLVSPKVQAPFDQKRLKKGQTLHQMSCSVCHSPPQSAFISYGLAKSIRPLALQLNKFNITSLIWYLHFLSCWIGLAYLPFSKMFHFFSAPLSLMANSVMEHGVSSPANIATRQVMELDACTHCGSCSQNCSVGIMYEKIGNKYILPSEKLVQLKTLISRKKMSKRTWKLVQEGLFLCTNCGRCTELCPVGINLQDLWLNAREMVLAKGYPEFLSLTPFSFYLGLMRQDLTEKKQTQPAKHAMKAISEAFPQIKEKDQILFHLPDRERSEQLIGLSSDSETFTYCYGCLTCSIVCPVVNNFEDPQQNLDLLPHQIMHSLVLGVSDFALGSRMLWLCLTCYQCQEHCPQGVKVTDVLYELKNLAVKKIKESDHS